MHLGSLLLSFLLSLLRKLIILPNLDLNQVLSCTYKLIYELSFSNQTNNPQSYPLSSLLPEITYSFSVGFWFQNNLILLGSQKSSQFEILRVAYPLVGYYSNSI